ncbi:15469_t:CDS:2, partial [Cetraspora pellucida]
VLDIRRDNFAEDDVWAEDFFAEDICEDVFAEDVFSKDIFAKSNEFDEKSGKELDEEAMMKDKKENARIIKELPKSMYYHKFSASGTLANAAKGTCQITDIFRIASKFLRRLSIPSTFPIFPITSWASEFFSRTTPLVSLSNENVDDEFTLHERIEQLKEDLTKNQKNLTAIEYNE